MAGHTAAIRRTVRDPARSLTPGSAGLAEWWDALMFMTTDARVRSNCWSPSNLRPPRALVNPADKVPLHWNRTSKPSNTPTSPRNMASKAN